MGPEATNRLAQQILALTPAAKDQDHIPIVISNNPQIPDRTQAILYGGEDPVPEMTKTANQLETVGADFLIMPCNTAHHFIGEIQSKVNIPILNMIEETARFVKENYPDARKVGLLATSGTVASRVYHNVFHAHGIDVITPDTFVQEQWVMEAIYGHEGIKAGHKEQPRHALETAAHLLVDEGAEVIIAACTEIPLALSQEDVNFVLLDPSSILADAAVQKALNPQIIPALEVRK